MGVRILHDRQGDMATMYCSASMFAFGPVFSDDDGHDADERLQSFLRFLGTTQNWTLYEKVASFGREHDPRELTDAGMARAYAEWLAQEDVQWAQEAEQSPAETELN